MRCHRVKAILLLAACASATAVADPRTPRVVAAKIVASIDGGAATDRPVYARADQKVVLYVAIEIEGGAWFSDAPKWQPLAKAPAIAIAWQRVEPADASISNED